MQTEKRHLVVATKNPGKVRELRALLGDLPLELHAADQMPEVDETGATQPALDKLITAGDVLAWQGVAGATHGTHALTLAWPTSGYGFGPYGSEPYPS